MQPWHVRNAFILLALSALSACSPAVPKWREVGRAERALSTNSCIGSLDDWDRKYFYYRRNEAVVGFTFDEAGVGNYRARRQIGGGEQFAFYDHVQRKFAAGEYDLRTGRLRIRYCGPVCGPAVPAGGSCG